MTHPAGWYADPFGRFQQRYWDGAAWTEHVSTNGAQAVDPLGSTVVIPIATPASAYVAPATGQVRRRRPPASRRKRSRIPRRAGARRPRAPGATPVAGARRQRRRGGCGRHRHRHRRHRRIAGQGRCRRRGDRRHRTGRATGAGASSRAGRCGRGRRRRRAGRAGWRHRRRRPRRRLGAVRGRCAVHRRMGAAGLPGTVDHVGHRARCCGCRRWPRSPRRTAATRACWAKCPTAGSVGDQEVVFLLAAAVLLGLVWWLDRAGYRGVGTSLVVAALVSAFVGVAQATGNLDDAGLAVLITIVGLIVCVVGSHGDGVRPRGGVRCWPPSVWSGSSPRR